MSAEEKPWTEAHQREALWRTYEIAAELVAAGRPELASGIAAARWSDEQRWGLVLASWAARVLCGTLTAVEWIARQQRRVRDLAEGRRVREEHAGYQYRVRMSNNAEPGPLVDLMAARWHARMWRRAYPGSTTKIVPVKVTRIRRAP